MPRRIDWTDDQLRSAVRASASWREVANKLGLARGSTHRVKGRAEELGLDASHMTGNRRWSAVELQTAITTARSWHDVAERLGTVPASVGRLRGAALRYGISTEHLDTAQPPATSVPLCSDISQLSRAAESFAQAWFLMMGRNVAMPAVAAPFDLLVSDGASHRRVQVKSTTHRDRRGRWVVVVAHRPYLLGARGGREPYDHGEVDEFFVINDAGDCYSIPIKAIAGRISIVLDHYPAHRVGNIGAIFESESGRS